MKRSPVLIFDWLLQNHAKLIFRVATISKYFEDGNEHLDDLNRTCLLIRLLLQHDPPQTLINGTHHEIQWSVLFMASLLG